MAPDPPLKMKAFAGDRAVGRQRGRMAGSSHSNEGAYPAVLVADEKCCCVWGQSCCLAAPAGLCWVYGYINFNIELCDVSLFKSSSSRLLLPAFPKGDLIRLCGKHQKILRLEALALHPVCGFGCQNIKKTLIC